jgi:peptidoglycan/LPS O-acetylase OafA/YrhL
MSYTLYLVHFSLVMFIWFAFQAPMQFQPDLPGMAIFAALLLTVLAYAYAIWWLFERQTSTLQRVTIVALTKWAKSVSRAKTY